MKKYYYTAGITGLAVNFLLFAVKLYIGNASLSLTIYCDAINNLGDTFSCAVAMLGFVLAVKLGDKRSLRAQSLAAFVISLIIALTGLFFVYRGLDRLMYPVAVSYTYKYVAVITGTIFVKLILGAVFVKLNKKAPSPIIRALALDSFLDCFITLFTLMSTVLIAKINFAFDAYFAFLCGTAITVEAVRCIIKEARFLINE
ncbi:MAG: cation transporter [Eubacterium sp.]|nr:cation transporter [Eubacterium sp.]